jgi:hypothetical protein
MAGGIKYWIKVHIGGMDYSVRLGDTVWFFPGCNMQSTPQCGTVTLISEDHMVDIAIQNVQLLRRVSETGVCLFGSEKLQNKVHRDRGCWMPRTPLQLIENSAAREG